MILVTTPTGNSGRHVLAEALRAAKEVRVLVRKTSKLNPALRSQCDVVQGDLRDEASLARAMAGVSAVFFCVPQSGESDDVAAYYQSFVEPAARACAAAGVKRVVTISGGRGNPLDRGPSGPLAAMEKAFDASVFATRHVRCGYFMENFLYMIPALKFTRAFSLPLRADQTLALESAEDIGKSAARWMLDLTWEGHEGVQVPQGEVRTCPEIASVLSEVLGKPITFKPVSGPEHRRILTKYGVSEAMAQSLVEMFEELESGSIGGSHANRKEGGLPFAVWAERVLKPQMRLIPFIKRMLG